MYHHQFPRCTVKGSFAPVPYSHLGLGGAVPAKCATCKHLFEGECTRVAGRFLALDHGRCGVKGSTQPLRIVNVHFESKVEVPTKCARCPKLAIDLIRGFHCNDAQWGAFKRALDWGAFEPETPSFEAAGRELTRTFVDAIFDGDDVAAFKEFRAANPDVSVREAKALIDEIRNTHPTKRRRDPGGMSALVKPINK